MSPFHVIFLRGWTGAQRASSVDLCDLDLDLNLEWSPKNEDVFQSLMSISISILISILSIALKARMCSGVRSPSGVEP